MFIPFIHSSSTILCVALSSSLRSLFKLSATFSLFLIITNVTSLIGNVLSKS